MSPILHSLIKWNKPLHIRGFYENSFHHSTKNHRTVQIFEYLNNPQTTSNVSGSVIRATPPLHHVVPLPPNSNPLPLGSVILRMMKTKQSRLLVIRFDDVSTTETDRPYSPVLGSVYFPMPLCKLFHQIFTFLSS